MVRQGKFDDCQGSAAEHWYYGQSILSQYRLDPNECYHRYNCRKLLSGIIFQKMGWLAQGHFIDGPIHSLNDASYLGCTFIRVRKMWSNELPVTQKLIE